MKENVDKPCLEPFSHCLDCDDHNQCERYGEHLMAETRAGKFQEKEDRRCGTCANDDIPVDRGSCSICRRQSMWTPRQPEGEKPEGMPTAKIEDFSVWTFKKIHELQRRLDAIEQTARTNPYHPFDIVGAVKELQEKVEAMEKTGG